MSKFLSALLFAWLASPTLSFADPLVTHRALSTRSASVALPKRLEFRAYNLRVLHAGWFNSLFDQDVCEKAMTADLNGRFEMKISGPHSLDLTWNGIRFSLLKRAYATYIPLYYDLGAPVAPHVLVQLPNFVFLHISESLRSEDGRREITVSVVRGKTKLLPIFKAIEF